MNNKITITKEGKTGEEICLVENTSELKGKYKNGCIIQEILPDVIQITPFNEKHIFHNSYSVHNTLAIVWNKKLSKNKLKKELNEFMEEYLKNDK